MAHKHTGKMHRGHGGIKSHTKQDSMAHESHHAANKEHGMKHGFAPPHGGYEGHEGAGGAPPPQSNEECD